mmetsp:Transcript_14458/g.16169  ORF Transcript_14458/g.16169 Transcript_14458/m.16169 type:complete len:269 (+) Transcript_14458:44-850(+)
MARNFGGGGAHFKRKAIHHKSQNVTYNHPVEEADLDQEFGKKRNNILHHRLIGKFVALTGANRTHLLDNTRVNTYSAYYWLPKIPFTASSLFLKTMALLFDKNRLQVGSVYDEPVQIHENSVFLYKTPNTPEWMGSRTYDYMALSFLVYGTCIASYPLMWLPIIPYLADLPKNLTHMKYLTYRADLLPHTEQVVFTKIGFFGTLRRSVVDIKHLVKVNPESIRENYRMFKRNDFDSRFIWKDSESGEVFIFHSDGVWSEEGINHPLIN